MSPTATSDPVVDDLMPAMSAVRRLLRRGAGAAFGEAVSAAQREVLLVVGRAPDRSVAQVADELGLAPNSVSTMVTQLVAAGLLARRTDPHDRRVGRLALSPGAAAELSATRDRRHALLRTAVDTLPPRERDDLAAGVAALRLLADGLRDGLRERLREGSGDGSSDGPSDAEREPT